jgi:hypothetical protein
MLPNDLGQIMVNAKAEMVLETGLIGPYLAL